MSTTNGTTAPKLDQMDLATLREHRSKLRLQREIKLLEGIGYGALPPSMTGGHLDFVDPLDRYRDGDKLVAPVGLPQINDGKQLFLIQSESELADVRTMAQKIVEINPLAGGALEGLCDFIIDAGYTFRASSKDRKAKQHAPLVAAVQDVIDEFVDANEFSELQYEICGRVHCEGESFLRYFTPKDRSEPLTLRTVEPGQVTNPPHAREGDGWSFGKRHTVIKDCETGKVWQDVARTEAFYLKYDAQDRGAEVPAAQMLHIKTPRTKRIAKRGVSDFFSTAEAFEGVRKLLRNLREGAAIQAAIAGIREHTAEKPKVEGFQSAVQSRWSQQSPITGRTVKYQHYEPGSILDVHGAKYLSPPWTGQGAPNFIAVIQACLRALGSRWRMPEFMISGDASNANYSSTLVAGAPFVRFVRRMQMFYKRRFLAIIWEALYHAIAVGRLAVTRDELRQLIDVQAEAPSPEIADEAKQATVDSQDIQNGVMSKQTRRQRRGLDDEQERANLVQEPPSPNLVLPGMGTMALPGMGAAPAAQQTDKPVPPQDETDPLASAKTGSADGADALRATVGGSQAVATLQAQYYDGKLPRAAAIANARLLFNFSPEEAESLFPETAPVKLTPDPNAAPPGGPAPPPPPDPGLPIAEGKRVPFWPRKA